MTDKPNTTNGEDISVRCFFDGERALHGSVHEDAPTRRVDKKNIIKDGCKPMTIEVYKPPAMGAAGEAERFEPGFHGGGVLVDPSEVP